MQELDDIALLREFTEHDSEPAFAALVTRHIDRVYSVALRHTRNPHSAEEITQAVFVILARKSKHLRKGVILEGWLYQTARLTALTFIRSEIRRARREQEAYMQNVLNENDSDLSRQSEAMAEAWMQIAPLLDTALAGLNETDRNAVVLRFFYGKSMSEIGMALGANEDTARMRINRAIGKLQKFFSKRGVNSTTDAISGAISANSIQIAPAILAKTATAVALAKGATASTSTLTLIKGALKIMAWTKTKTAVVVGVVALFAATSTTIIGIKLAWAHRMPPDTTALSPVAMNIIADIQLDSSIRIQATVEDTNNTSRIAYADSINDAQAISKIIDGSGQPMKFSKRPGGGFYVFPNKPVPPGGELSYTVQGMKVSGLIQSKGGGEYGVDFTEGIGNVAEVHIVQVWRLPPSATLLGKDRGMEATTDAGQIELRIDKIIPPNGSFPVGFRYRLPASAN